MSGIPSKLFDSALAIAIISAALYFLGIVNSEGDARALNLPPALFSRDLWGTLAYGGEGLLLYTVLLPFSTPSIGSAAIGTFFIFLFVVFASSYFLRKLKHQLLIAIFLSYVALVVHVMACSYWQMIQQISIFTTCLNDRHSCNLVSLPLENRVVFSKTDNEEDERNGIILSANGTHLIMLTKNGLFVMPMSRLKLIETSH